MWRPPLTGAFDFVGQLEFRSGVMTDPMLDEVELVVDALKGVSPEEQEAAILELEERNPGVGERVRALLVIERQAIEAIRKAEADGRRIVAKAKARAEAVRKPAEPKA